MGFYTPSTILEDARRHGVEVRPIDVTTSAWDCTLEGATGSTRVICMGLRYVKGLARAVAERILAARSERPFASVEDFITRAAPDDGSLARLAEAGALAPFEQHRRNALWRVHGQSRAPRAALAIDEGERTPRFAALDTFDEIDWDYRTSGHSTRGHPLEPMREQLLARRLPDARTVASLPDGRRVRYAGIVICRQRPGTASGVVFMTLEDETGFVNVVVWNDVYERNRVVIRTTSFLGVTGRLQVQQGVVHLVADAFWVPRVSTRPRSGGARDFH
jgi:error-prone DNA polymerase